jgi:hypothetical protein
MAQIPARYIGHFDITLSKLGGPYYNGNGQRLTDFVIHPGDTLMMGDEEILGFTMLLDPRHEQPARKLGVGRVVLDQDKGLSDQELLLKGYQFHTGRSDFEPIKITAPLGDSE